MCSPLVKPNGAGGRREGFSRCRSPERRGNCDKACVSKARPAVQRPTQIYVPKVRPKVQRPDPLPAKTLGPTQINILKIRRNFLPSVNLRGGACRQRCPTLPPMDGGCGGGRNPPDDAGAPASAHRRRRITYNIQHVINI